MVLCPKSRRGPALALMAAAVMLGWQQPALAGCEEFRGRTIRWIVPWSVGGGYDTYSRLIGPAYAERLGTDIRFENVPGAGGRIGTERIMKASPDGFTVGIVSGMGLTTLRLSGDGGAPDLQKDFSLLGRIHRDSYLLATGAGSRIERVEQLWQADSPPPVFAVTGPAAGSFVVSVIAAHLLGIVPDLVSGYRGSRQTKLAAIRGEVDVIAHQSSSLQGMVDAGDLRPLLRIGGAGKTSTAAPPLGGENGLALARARELGRDLEDARADTRALLGLIKLGRLVAAPRSIDPPHLSCMVTALAAALRDPAVVGALAVVGRSVDPAAPEQALADLAAVSSRSRRLQPVIAAALARLRR